VPFLGGVLFFLMVKIGSAGGGWCSCLPASAREAQMTKVLRLIVGILLVSIGAYIAYTYIIIGGTLRGTVD
jgi:hypothetical protein